MERHPRATRVDTPRLRVLVASTYADLINLSWTGALIHITRALRPGSEWPLVLELPDQPVRCTGRIVRCEPAELPAGSGVLRTLYVLTVTFVEPSPVVREALDQICGPADATGD